MFVSFVIIFSSNRINNLNQTLRFLFKREIKLHQSEIVLACQDSCEVKSPFCNTKIINFGMDSYEKSYMTNRAVEQSSGEIVVLLDSDRILPKDYFFRAAKMIRQNTIITTERMYNLDKDYKDSEIENGEVAKTPDFRSKELLGRKKNTFAGNTVMMKSDFFGYDESFTSYGFADTDMSRSALHRGMNVIYLEDEELHLWHPKEIYRKGELLEVKLFQIIVATNALRYCNKWNTPLDEGIKEVMVFAERDHSIYDSGLYKEYVKERTIAENKGLFDKKEIWSMIARETHFKLL